MELQVIINLNLPNFTLPDIISKSCVFTTVLDLECSSKGDQCVKAQLSSSHRFTDLVK